MGKPKVPNTISDKQAASLRRRAGNAAVDRNQRAGLFPAPRQKPETEMAHLLNRKKSRWS